MQMGKERSRVQDASIMLTIDVMSMGRGSAVSTNLCFWYIRIYCHTPGSMSPKPCARVLGRGLAKMGVNDGLYVRRERGERGVSGLWSECTGGVNEKMTAVGECRECTFKVEWCVFADWIAIGESRQCTCGVNGV